MKRQRHHFEAARSNYYRATDDEDNELMIDESMVLRKRADDEDNTDNCFTDFSADVMSENEDEHLDYLLGISFEPKPKRQCLDESMINAILSDETHPPNASNDLVNTMEVRALDGRIKSIQFSEQSLSLRKVRLKLEEVIGNAIDETIIFMCRNKPLCDDDIILPNEKLFMVCQCLR